MEVNNTVCNSRLQAKSLLDVTFFKEPQKARYDANKRMAAIRERLRALLDDQKEIAGKSQVGLAAALKCTQGRISHLLAGRNPITDADIEGACAYFGISLNQFFAGADGDDLHGTLQAILDAGGENAAAIRVTIDSIYRTLRTERLSKKRSARAS